MSNTPVRRFGRPRALSLRVFVAAATVLAVSAPLAVTAGAEAATPGPKGDNGFPTYYTDDDGVSLRMCEDAARCGIEEVGPFAPPNGERVYYAATATAGGLSVSFEIAAEYDTEVNPAGVPLIEEGALARGDMPRPGTYTIEHPYGTSQVVTDAAGRVKNQPLNVTISHFLRQTTAVPGFLGDPEATSTVIGGPARNTVVVRDSRGRVVAQTDQLSVVGHVIGAAAMLSQRSLDFGNVPTAQTRHIRLTNIGEADQTLSLGSITASGSRTIRVLQSSGCAAMSSLVGGQSCLVGVRYTPRSGVKSSSATLAISAGARTLRVPVKAASAALVSARDSLRFATRKVGTESAARRIVVTNTGAVPLKIKSMGIQGFDRRSFSRTTGDGPMCAVGRAVRRGAACAIYVSFEPRSAGIKRANLVIRSNALGRATFVRLQGRGRR